MYVLPAPVQAAPLPPGLCPQGDSMSIGILWNLFSYSRSSTRSEMECLHEVLASIKPATPVVQQLAPLTPEEKATLERLDRESKERAAISSSAASAPASTPRAPAAGASATKPSAKKATVPKKAASKSAPTSSCEETALQSCKAPKKT
jgi:hypothetical protein